VHLKSDSYRILNAPKTTASIKNRIFFLIAFPSYRQ